MKDSWNLKSVGSCLVGLVASGAFAGAVTGPLDGVITVHADVGEVYTYATALAAASQVVKTGAGEVKLTAATTAFTGDVTVKEGVLSIGDKAALGSKATVTVENGAAFYLRTGHGTAQSTIAWPNHEVVIAGVGPDGQGAFDFQPNDGVSAPKCTDDTLLSKLTLSDDATVRCAYRWGFGPGSTVTLNGHTLTRVGGNNWMFISGPTITEGKILSKAGTMTLQNSLNCTGDPTTSAIVASNSTVSLWGLSTQLRIPLVAYGSTISAGSTPNRLGDVVVSTNAAGTYSYFDVPAGKNVYINGALTARGGRLARTYRSDGKYGAIYFQNAVTIENTGATLYGTNYVNNAFTAKGDTYLKGCRTTFAGDFARTFTGLVLQDSPVVTLDAGTLSSTMIRFSNGGAVESTFWQRGGSFLAASSGDTSRIGELKGSGSAYLQDAGTAQFNNGIYLGEHRGSYGVWQQRGGETTMKNGALVVGRSGEGLYVQTGGTNDTQVKVDQTTRIQLSSAGGCADFALSGSNTLCRTARIYMGCSTNVCTNVVSLASGATLSATRFNVSETRKAGSCVTLWMDGGILQPRYCSNWNGATTAAGWFPRNPDHVVIAEGGAVYDTGICTDDKGKPRESSSHFTFKALEGRGIASVTLPSEVLEKTNYNEPMRLEIEGAGWGAAAYAEFDPLTRMLTNVVVTAAGCNYDETTKVYVRNANRTTRYECPYTLTAADRKDGGLTKLGANSLNLISTNVYFGGTRVLEGTLSASNVDSLPKNTAYTIAAGASLTFNANQGTFPMTTLAGAGTVSGANLEVSEGLEASTADLFAGRSLTVAKKLTFGPDAVFKVSDPEALEAYAHTAHAVALTATGGITGPLPRVDVGDAKGSWVLYRKDANTLKFGCTQGTVIILR